MELSAPFYVAIVFILTAILTLYLFFIVLRNSSGYSHLSGKITLVLILWLLIQALLSVSGLYSTDTKNFPPKFILLVLPPLITILIVFLSEKGRSFCDSLPLLNLTYLSIVRIPVEFVLLWLFFYKAVPGLMTFEGRNFDIIAGITAPFVAYYGIKEKKLNEKMIMLWHVVCLGLLINIIMIAFLSAPFATQKFAYDMPNIAVLYFPYSWLPGFIVPAVLLSHLVSIRQLTGKLKL